MLRWAVLLVSLCTLGACTVEDRVSVPDIPPPPVVQPPVEAPPPPVVMTPIVYQEPPVPPPPADVKPAPAKRGAKPLPQVQTTPPAPAQVIQSAHKSAQVQPTARGYFGGSAIHRYPWQLGKLYTVYVAPGKTTMLQLPPGEKLASALHLSAEDWEVSMVLVGNEVRQQNVIFVTPLVPHGDADIALVCETGRSFNVHLVVGKVGMFGVTWEIPPVGEIYVDESPIAGRP